MSQKAREHSYSLWNNDLLTMPHHPLVGKAFLFKGLKIKEVAVCGVVTSVERMKSVISYHIDDGTGVILCALDEAYAEHHQKEAMSLLDFHRDPVNICQPSNVALMSMLERAVDVFDGKYKLQEGDSVYIVGKISQCTEELRVVTISFICPLEDFRSEILTMELRSQFYKAILNGKDKVVGKKENSVSKLIASENYSDNDSNSDENFLQNLERRKSLSYEKINCYVGEWHEEYFMYRDEQCREFDFDDQIPDC